MQTKSAAYQVCMAFNRTIVELKSISLSSFTRTQPAFNRTIVELK